MLKALSAGTLKRLYTSQRFWIAKGSDMRHDDARTGMRELLEHFLADEAVTRTVAEASVYDPAIRNAYRDSVRDYARAMERLIRRGQQEGWARVGLHPADTATALAWMTDRTTSNARRLAPPDGRLADALASAICATLFE